MATTAEKTAERIENSVPVSTDETAPQESSMAMEPTDGEGTPQTPAEEPAPSAKDTFRSRFSERYPDVNMDDEESYYGQAGKMMDEYDGYKQNLDNVREAVGSSEDFQEMLAELSDWNQEHKDQPYSIMHFIARKVADGELDLDELGNPEYADKIAEAQSKKTKDAEEKKALEEEGNKNFEESIAMMTKVRDEMGLSDDQVNSAMEKLYNIYDGLRVNKISEEDFKAILNALSYDDSVAQARAEGKAEGVNTKVRDSLRKMPKTNERAGGSQSAIGETAPDNASKNNMFGV